MTFYEWSQMSGKRQSEWLSENNKANNLSMARRSKLYGVGVNDALYSVSLEIEGKRVKCPAYESWRGMFTRAYSEKAAARNSAYVDVTVCDEWHLFSKFRAWWMIHNVDGYVIDKDILTICGSDTYSPSACVFVPKHFSNLLQDSKASRGAYPIGVSYHRAGPNPYAASVRVRGEMIRLGTYPSVQSASAAYNAAKLAHIDEMRPELDAVDVRLYPSIRAKAVARDGESIWEAFPCES